MTDDFDELVSAYVDGDLSPAERARVEADPAAMQRVAVFSDVADLVAATPPPSTELRERLVGAALDASATAPNVTSLAARRSKRTKTLLAGAVAAMALVVAGIVAFNNNDASDLTSADDAAESTDDAAAADATQAVEAESFDESFEADLDSAGSAAGADAAEEAADGGADDSADADDAMADDDAAFDTAVATVFVADRNELEDALTGAGPAARSVVTMNDISLFGGVDTETIIACTEALSPELNGEIDGVARAVITDTSSYLGVPPDAEVLVVVAGDSYVLADEATCEVFVTESLFS